MSMSNTNKRVKEIRRKTRRKFSSEEKIRIVLVSLLEGPQLAVCRPSLFRGVNDRCSTAISTANGQKQS